MKIALKVGHSIKSIQMLCRHLISDRETFKIALKRVVSYFPSGAGYPAYARFLTKSKENITNQNIQSFQVHMDRDFSRVSIPIQGKPSLNERYTWKKRKSGFNLWNVVKSVFHTITVNLNKKVKVINITRLRYTNWTVELRKN